MIPHDYHVHSNFSCDCQATMAEQCVSAIAHGLPEIGFADHFNLHPRDECCGYFRLADWAAEIDRVRAAFADRLIVRAGIEIGEPQLYGVEAQALLRRYPFDYALGSLHWIGDVMVFDPAYFQRPAAEAFGRFFEELERVTRVGGFDVLSHFDVVVRRGLPSYGEYDPRRYEDAIRAVLKNCIGHGIALDINSQDLRTRCGVLTPDVEILRWYAELGGERVTLGSDAHQPEDVGADLDAALDAARAAGLKYVTQFERRQARLVRI
jgi:histidinol-phosphatase (PHP family)